MSTFVTVGNNKKPFTRLVDAIQRIAPHLPQPVVVQHGHTPFRCQGCIAVPFMGMEDFITRVRQAELVIAHAGVGSIIHAIQQGKVPVIMPRRLELGEHVDNHQLELVEALTRNKRAVTAENADELLAAAHRALEIQHAGLHEKTSIDESAVEPKLVALVRDVLSRYESQYP